MKLPSAFILLHNVVLTLTRRKSDLAFRGMQLSHTKQYMQFVQGNQMTALKRRHADENELIQTQFEEKKKAAGDDQTQVQQIQMEQYSALQAVSSKQGNEEQQIMQGAKNKEIPLDMEIELNNTQSQVVGADLDSYQKTLENALKGNGME